MAFVVAALQVSDKIQTVGAFAAFAAIIGLAVMSVLYFGQAREVKRLREWAGRAPERAAEMQDRVATDASKRVVAQPVAQTRPSATQPATPGAAAAAGTVAGAATAATAAPARPGQIPAAGAIAPSDGTDQPTVLQTPVAGGTTAPAGAPQAPGVPPATPGAPAGTPGLPTPAGAGAPGAPGTPAQGPAPVRPTPAARPEPAVPLRSARAARAEAAASATPQKTSSSPAGATIAIVGAVAAIIVAVVLVATGVIGGGGGGGSTSADTNEIVPTAPAATTSTGGGTKTTSKTTPVQRGSISVVVLNGTGTPNLARSAADALIKDGYTNAGAGNRGDATVAKTLVMYAPGGQRAAQDVAKLIGVTGVSPLDTGTEVVAKGFAKDGKTPLVVVTLGADKAQQ